MAMAIPIVMLAAGAAQAASQKQAGDYNAQVRGTEGRAAEQQSLVGEAEQRQSGREFIGRQAAAIGAAGIGYGGSSAGVLDQTARRTELDALQVRYRGQFTKYGYDAESTNARYEGRVGAGLALLRGASSAYASYSGSGTDLGG